MNSAPRVADLLHDPVLDGAHVVAGAAGMERRVTDVLWYDGAFGDVADHLVVCSDAQASPPYRLEAVVRRAQEAGAAALLVVAGTTKPLLSTVRLADRLEIPVLWLESGSPGQIALELTALVRAPEQVRARTIERLLRQLGTKRTGQDILATAESVLSAKVSLMTSDGVCILGEQVPTDPRLHLDQAVAQHGEHLLVHPVLDPQVNRLAAWLACPFERAADARLDVLAVGLAMTEPFIRSWLSGQRAQADRDSVFRAQLISEIIAGRDSVSRDVVEGAVSLGWRLPGWHVGIHVLSEAGDHVDRERMIDQLTTALAGHGIELVAAARRGPGWAMWITTDDEPAPDDARRLMRAVRLVTAALPRDWSLTAGIGRPHRGPNGLAESLSEARDAADLARSHDFRPAVEHSDELGVARLLATWQRSDVTRAFAETALSPLRDPSHSHLLSTLHAYLESGGSAVLTAQALGVHRNTVTTRIQQIRDRLGVDLDDPSQRLALQVACRALDV